MNDEQKTVWQPNAETAEDTAETAVTSEAPEQPVADQLSPEEAPITWTAQEYVHIDKNAGWYILFALVVLAFITIDVFFLRSWTFSALVVVMAVAVVVYIRRPPRELTYALSPKQGLYVGEQLHTFDEFKAFGLINDDGNFSIMMIPRKRFAPGVSVFFPQDAGERIVDILGKRLPMQELKLDVIDVVVRKLRL